MKDRAALYLIKEAEEKGLYYLLLTFFIIMGANSYRPSDSSLQLELIPSVSFDMKKPRPFWDGMLAYDSSPLRWHFFRLL